MACRYDAGAWTRRRTGVRDGDSARTCAPGIRSILRAGVSAKPDVRLSPDPGQCPVRRLQVGAARSAVAKRRSESRKAAICDGGARRGRAGATGSKAWACGYDAGAWTRRRTGVRDGDSARICAPGIRSILRAGVSDKPDVRPSPDPGQCPVRCLQVGAARSAVAKRRSESRKAAICDGGTIGKAATGDGRTARRGEGTAAMGDGRRAGEHGEGGATARRGDGGDVRGSTARAVRRATRAAQYDGQDAATLAARCVRSLE